MNNQNSLFDAVAAAATINKQKNLRLAVKVTDTKNKFIYVECRRRCKSCHRHFSWTWWFRNSDDMGTELLHSQTESKCKTLVYVWRKKRGKKSMDVSSTCFLNSRNFLLPWSLLWLTCQIRPRLEAFLWPTRWKSKTVHEEKGKLIFSQHWVVPEIILANSFSLIP